MLLARMVFIWLAVGNAAALSFTIGVAVFYQFSVTNPNIQIGVSQLGAQTLGFFVPVIVAATAISIIHVLVVLYSLAPTRRLLDRISARIWWQRPTRIEPTGMNTIAITSPRVAISRRGSAMALATNFWSRNSAEITRLFIVWEVVLQTFQAYKISYLVARVSINRMVALVIVINCWFSPLLHYALGSRPMVHVELGRLLMDSSLDLIYNVLIPLSIFYPYYRDFDGSVSLYPNVFYYDDTWYVNAISELRQVFVTSWLDFISKFGGSIGLVYQLWKVKAAMDELASRGPTPATISDSAPANVKRVPSYAKPRQWHRSRVSHLLDFILVIWGATIFSLHLTTTITSFRFYDPDCLLEMRPWGSLAYSCASFEISCSKRHTTGDRQTMETILRTIDPLSVQNLILSNCPELHVPSAIQQLKYLSMLKIYNSTIASWDSQSALRQVYHPQLQVIYFARVNASSFPEVCSPTTFPSRCGILNSASQISLRSPPLDPYCSCGRRRIPAQRVQSHAGCRTQRNLGAPRNTTTAPADADRHQRHPRSRSSSLEDAEVWKPPQARAYHDGCLKATLVDLRWHRKTDTEASCHTAVAIEILRQSDPEREPRPTEETPAQHRYILFFDGGSRGNPGPGGSGAIVVRTNQHATQASIVWSAATSLANATTTNNQAEYRGVLEGLREAHAQQWIPLEVVGDSQLILGQLRQYRAPRNHTLRQLYAEARRLGDQLGVRRWIHHLRAYNKMADAAANAAMDTKQSSHVQHPTPRAQHASLAHHLGSDFAHWQAQHFARLAVQ